MYMCMDGARGGEATLYTARGAITKRKGDVRAWATWRAAHPPAIARVQPRAFCTGGLSREKGLAPCLNVIRPSPYPYIVWLGGGPLPGVGGGGAGVPPGCTRIACALTQILFEQSPMGVALGENCSRNSDERRAVERNPYGSADSDMHLGIRHEQDRQPDRKSGG